MEKGFFNKKVTMAVFHKDGKVECEVLLAKIMLRGKAIAEAVRLMK